MRKPLVDLSISLPAVADKLEKLLDILAGQHVGFVLMVSTENATQYVSNLNWPEVRKAMESLLAGWKAGKADIPAHHNPDLRDIQ